MVEIIKKRKEEVYKGKGIYEEGKRRKLKEIKKK